MYCYENKVVDDICAQLWALEGSLKGVSALFKQSSPDSSLCASEIFGLGQLLAKMAEDLNQLEESLRYSHSECDSSATTKP